MGLGKMWRTLPKQDKQPYQEKAKLTNSCQFSFRLKPTKSTEITKNTPKSYSSTIDTHTIDINQPTGEMNGTNRRLKPFHILVQESEAEQFRQVPSFSTLERCTYQHSLSEPKLSPIYPTPGRELLQYFKL